MLNRTENNYHLCSHLIILCYVQHIAMLHTTRYTTRQHYLQVTVTMDKTDTDYTFQTATGDQFNTGNVEHSTGYNDEYNTENVELNTENVELNTPKDFPLSKRQTAKFLRVSDMTIARWLDSLENVGIIATDHKNKVTRHGYKHLDAIKQASEDGIKPVDYIQSLIPLEPVTVETDPSFTSDVFPVSSSELSIVHGELDRVSGLTSQSLARVSRLKSEFSDLLGELETDRQLQAEISELRLAKIQETALSEFIEEEKMKARIKRQLLAQKLASELE